MKDFATNVIGIKGNEKVCAEYCKDFFNNLLSPKLAT
jgi:hypothetical protein